MRDNTSGLHPALLTVPSQVPTELSLITRRFFQFIRQSGTSVASTFLLKNPYRVIHTAVRANYAPSNVASWHGIVVLVLYDIFTRVGALKSFSVSPVYDLLHPCSALWFSRCLSYIDVRSISLSLPP